MYKMLYWDTKTEARFLHEKKIIYMLELNDIYIYMVELNGKSKVCMLQVLHDICMYVASVV